MFLSLFFLFAQSPSFAEEERDFSKNMAPLHSLEFTVSQTAHALVSNSAATHSSWVSVQADRGNLLYKPGEQANFRLRKNVFLSNPQFFSETTLQQEGSEPQTIFFTSGFGYFQSTPLSQENLHFRILTKIKDSNSSWESTVQDETFELQISVE